MACAVVCSCVLQAAEETYAAEVARVEAENLRLATLHTQARPTL